MSATPASRAAAGAAAAADDVAPTGIVAPTPTVRHAPRASRIDDVPAVRVHHPSDLLGTVLSALGVALVLVLATYAHNTTSGVAEDVQGFATLLTQILFVPGLGCSRASSSSSSRSPSSPSSRSAASVASCSRA